LGIETLKVIFVSAHERDNRAAARFIAPAKMKVTFDIEVGPRRARCARCRAGGPCRDAVLEALELASDAGCRRLDRGDWGGIKDEAAKGRPNNVMFTASWRLLESDYHVRYH
jgi:hypothetical protein